MLQIDRIRLDPAYHERLCAHGLSTVEAALSRLDGQVFAWSRSTDTVYIRGLDGRPGFFLKRYYYPSWLRRIRGMFRGTFFGLPRAQAEAQLLNEMRALGVPAVRPVACGTRRVGHFVTACFLATEEVPGARNLTTFAADAASGEIRLTLAQRRALIKALAQHIANAHSAGFAHGQLFWRNILVRIGPSGDGEFFFLDARPRRAGRRRGRRSEWWIEEIAHLAASARPFTTRAERMRFLIAYYGARSLTPDRRRQIRHIDRLAQRWSRHERQRIRMSERFEEWNRRLQSELAASGGSL
ncbi:MAG: hypothetical protein HZB38_14375 [Planctomycetes bacterium]|nr:hypothetical protein [Planctomycetota bacterium]